MRQLEERVVKYIGYDEPQTVDETQIEIMGLKQAVKEAELRIAKLNLGYVIATAEHANKEREAFEKLKKEKEESENKKEE